MAPFLLTLLLSVLSPEQWENRTINHLNAERAENSAQVVHRGSCVDRHAERWVTRLAHEDALRHRRNLPVVMRRCRGALVGEILAKGTSSPHATVRAWLRSPTHRAVMLNPRYDNVGVAAKKTRAGQWVVVANWIDHAELRPL